MILLLNLLITEERINTATNKYDRTGLKNYSRLDIFKYSLASLAKIPWSKAIIFCELAGEFKGREQELTEFIERQFCETPVYLRFKRNEYQADWQDTLNKYVFPGDDDCIFFLCNDDHVFLGNADYIQKIEQVFIEHKDNGYISCYPSHWPELLYMADMQRAVSQKDFFIFNLSNNTDSVQFVNRNVLKHWWFSRDYGDTFLPRSDYFNAHVDPVDMLCLVPKEELVRHFDGYGHVSVFEDCMPLEIPEGFLAGEDFSVVTKPDDQLVVAGARAKVDGKELTLQF